MAIPGQQNINIGQPNQSANSDSLFVAFNTIQNNFTTLFSTSSPISNLVAGPGINVVSTTSNTVQIRNTGVTSIIAGNNITITSTAGTPTSNGAIIISATGGNGTGGGVTSVGLISNTLNVNSATTPIISSGNIQIELPNVGITAGSYRNPNVTVDAQGRITTIANGAVTGVTSVGLIPGTGISVSGSPVNGSSGSNTGAGNITVTNTGVTGLVAGTGIVLSTGSGVGNGVITISSTGGGGGGSGTVTSVGVTSSTLTVTGSPIVSSGVININLPSSISVNDISSNTANILTLVTGNLNATTEGNVPFTATIYSNSTAGNNILIKRARGNSTTPVSVSTGDQLMGIRSQGYSPFNVFQTGAGMVVTANGTPANSSSFFPSEVAIVTASTTGTQSFKFTSLGNLVIPGAFTTATYSNSVPITTQLASRSRGVVGTPSPIAAGDFLYRLLALGYTGNGLSNVDSVTGYSPSASIEVIAAAVPSSPGAFIPSNITIRTVSTSNTVNILTLTSTGNLLIPGVAVGNGAGLTNLTAANIVGTVPVSTVAGTVTTAAQPNITSVGTLTDLTVSGNTTTGGIKTDNYYYANGSPISFAGTYSNSNVASYLPTYTGNIQAGNVSISGSYTGNASGISNIPAANLSGNVNNNISVTTSANTTATVGNLVSITINGTTYQLLAV